MYRTAIILCAWVIWGAYSYCRPIPKTNLEVFEDIISAGLDKFYYYPGVNRSNLFIFELDTDISGGSENSRIRFLKGIIKKTASQNKLNFSFASGIGGEYSDSAYNLLILGIPKLETKYTGFKKNTFLGSKTIIRNITVNIAAELKTSDGKVNLHNSINSSASDEVNFDKYEQLESSDYEFTVGTPPQVSVPERVFFPVLVICATAAATILFFIIRSK